MLLWPRGAAAAVQRSVDTALGSAGGYLRAAVLRVTRGASAEHVAQLRDLRRESQVAARTYGDAIRIYLGECNGAIDPGLLDTTNRIPRLRTAADLVADIAPPPPGPYPRARKVLEEHTFALCARLDGSDPQRTTAEMNEQFVTALRAEAHGPNPGLAALPLVTAAANIGELELIYPSVENG